MRITSLTISNFRCFGEVPTRIDLDAMTTFVGGNACGKTAALGALARLFGVTPGDRGIRRSDFHLPPDKDPNTVSEMTLFIEARIDFPELDGDTPADSVPTFFRQMKVDVPKGPLHCRVRLDAKWTRTTLPEGEVEETLSWVNTASDDVAEEDKTKVTGDQRSRIHVLYVPATRDPLRQLRQAAGTLLHRLLSAIRWSDELREQVETASRESNAAFREEAGVAVIEKMINKNWAALHDFAVLRNVHFRPLNPQFEDLLRQVEMVFSPGEGDAEQPADRLSDGLRSLFYLTLITAVFHTEDQAVSDSGDDSPLRGAELDVPSLTVLAIEEPENHLAPHYLGRILALLEDIAGSPRAQVLLTSHSPAILKRIDPASVRHLRLDLKTHQTIVKAIKLPATTHAAHKYVREAVRAYPELYFARLVVLCEGASEEIVLPRLCEEADVRVDPSFVSVVPLGGRHVNHFWKLLNDLSIPHVTLIDLDREREFGGWSRVHYLIKQLIAVGKPRDTLLGIGEGETAAVLTDDEFEKMKGWPSDDPNLEGWLNFLEKYDVFVSHPLDLDFAMLRTFPAAYKKAKSGTGPRIPNRKTHPKRHSARVKAACKAVLKSAKATGATFDDDEKHAFIWYQHLFLGRGKPSTHILALNEIPKGDLWKQAPDRLKRLVTRVRKLLK